MADRRERGGADSERGSILPLILGVVVFALVLVLVGAAATSLYVERKRLFTLADGAALAGAEAFTMVASDGPRRPVLDSGDVASAATAYLTRAATTALESLRLERAHSPDGASARVTLSSWWRPPLITAFVPDGIRLEVTAHARTALR
ncbi:pilus assembly protein TadG-related protein [Ruicaihuangia caeni]|uniref:Pilus assembly protein TadG-related protein n=1 Tax=Ruicaihuangia caeni TaxID=3042517 RepID=A0AAW6T248_9MICO|nr:pilus assembly protein TadG-related protein [Klugiella sp. YN-L-19]MDI2097404.1 pilus assembly protein TadG-related protein [Klugiella sp. YN-L-19]